MARATVRRRLQRVDSPVELPKGGHKERIPTFHSMGENTRTMLKKICYTYATGVVAVTPIALYANRAEEKVTMKYIVPVQMSLTWPLTAVVLFLDRAPEKSVCELRNDKQ